jgi:predicted DCC family thiol-disulfide oxidoreductase YuxK
MSADVFVYDGECGFCTWWADYFARRTDLEMVPFAALSDELRQRLPAEYEDCSHLVTDDAVYSCGAATERALARADVPPGAEDVFDFLRNFEDYERLRERLYRAVADRRDDLGQFVSKADLEGGSD